MSDQSHGPILVGVDGSPNASIAAAWAVEIGRRTDTSVKALVAWTEPRTPILERADDFIAGMSHQQAEEAEQILHDAGMHSIEVTPVRGPVSEALLRVAEDLDAAMVVVGTRGLGLLSGLLLGSVSRDLLFNTGRPLIVVPKESTLDPPKLTRVLVGVDCSPVAEAVLNWAAGFCVDVGVPATIVRCTDPGCERPPGHVESADDRVTNEAEAALEVFRARGVDYDVAVSHCDPREALVDMAKDVGSDLIIIGTRGEGQFMGLGGTASYLARHAPVPLAVIP